jgi:hypothetical protein
MGTTDGWRHSPRLTRRTQGIVFSEGARLLWLELERRQMSVESMRAELDFAKSILNRYLYGDMLPGLRHAFRIFDAFGVDPRLWTEPATERFRLPGARRRVA